MADRDSNQYWIERHFGLGYLAAGARRGKLLRLACYLLKKSLKARQLWSEVCELWSHKYFV